MLGLTFQYIKTILPLYHLGTQRALPGQTKILTHLLQPHLKHLVLLMWLPLHWRDECRLGDHSEEHRSSVCKNHPDLWVANVSAPLQFPRWPASLQPSPLSGRSQTQYIIPPAYSTMQSIDIDFPNFRYSHWFIVLTCIEIQWKTICMIAIQSNYTMLEYNQAIQAQLVVQREKFQGVKCWSITITEIVQIFLKSACAAMR